MDRQEKYGPSHPGDEIAFGEAILISPPPSRSQICDRVACHRLDESGFGGWADEKIETAREAAPRLDRKKSHPQHLTIAPECGILKTEWSSILCEIVW